MIEIRRQSGAIDGIVAQPMVERFPVAPETVEVLGSKPKGPSDPLWSGLDLGRAELRTQATIMQFICGSAAPRDLHLRVLRSRSTNDA